MQKKCNNCGNNFEGNARSRFCSDVCRVAAWRKAQSEITIVGDEGLPRLLAFCKEHKVTIANIVEFIEERYLAIERKFNSR